MPVATAELTTAYQDPSGTYAAVTFDGKNAPLQNARKYAVQNQFTIKHLVEPPSQAGEPGFQRIEMRPNSEKVQTDGILVTQGVAIGMYSRDCPIVFLVDTQRKEGVFVHCGRYALTPTQFLMNRNFNVLTAALRVLTERGSKVEDLSAYITAGICQDCFVHNMSKDAHLLKPLMAHYPYCVEDETGGLDLIGIIFTHLQRAGVVKIEHDGLCTKEHDGLASKRGGDKDSNLVIAYIL